MQVYLHNRFLLSFTLPPTYHLHPPSFPLFPHLAQVSRTVVPFGTSSSRSHFNISGTLPCGTTPVQVRSRSFSPFHFSRPRTAASQTAARLVSSEFCHSLKRAHSAIPAALLSLGQPGYWVVVLLAVVLLYANFPITDSTDK